MFSRNLGEGMAPLGPPGYVYNTYLGVLLNASLKDDNENE